MKYGPVGVSPGATIGDMITNSQPQKPKMPNIRGTRGIRRVDEDLIRTTVDFRPSPMPVKGKGRAV